jgi:hypothetical protein
MFNGLLSSLGLATATGLNAWLPLLVVGLLARWTDLVKLNPPYDWLSEPVVLIVLAILCLLDFIADKIPAVDHAMHAVGIVLHPVAGALVSLAANSEAGEVHPVLSIVCGLILAGGTHGARAAVRPVATATTGGLANPVLSLIEDVLSLSLAFLAVVLPVVALGVIALVFVGLGWRLLRFVHPSGGRQDQGSADTKRS